MACLFLGWVVVFHQQVEDLTSVNFMIDSGGSTSWKSRSKSPSFSTVLEHPVVVPSLQQRQERYYSKFQYRPAEARTMGSLSIDPECGQPPNYQSYFAQSQMFRSSRNEDRIIYELLVLPLLRRDETTLSNRSTYVELGAFNGKRESNTRFFDLCLHWDGLLIEANPLKYPKLLENRPHAHCMNFAPSCNNNNFNNNGPPDVTMIPFHSVAFTNAAQANVLSHYDNTNLVNIPCDQLTPPVLDILGGNITFFSLDVEGAENQVLRTVDFSKVHVDIWMVENVNYFCQREERCESRDESRGILQRAGYVGFQDIVYGSDIFVLPSSEYDKLLSSRFDRAIHGIENINLG